MRVRRVQIKHVLVSSLLAKPNKGSTAKFGVRIRKQHAYSHSDDSRVGLPSAVPPIRAARSIHKS